jgi:FkbM family methyltransferase
MPLDTQNSHTLALVSEALAAVEDYCSSQHTQELLHPVAPHRLHGLTHGLNRLAGAVGLHVARLSYMNSVEALHYDTFSKWTATGTLRAILEDAAPFDVAYGLLADDASRRVFDWYVQCRTAYALVGRAALTLFPTAVSDAEYEQQMRRLGKPAHGVYRLGGWAIRSEPDALVESVMLEQYKLDGAVDPQPGWTALDCGAYMGETALWLAQKLGPAGTVVAVEPGVESRTALTENLMRNASPSMADMRVCPLAVGERSESRRFVAGAGSASTFNDAGTTTVEVATIDDLVAQEHLSQVDLIKMDIEGAEVDALKGARGTLQRFAPALAICVYHKPRDLPDVVTLLHEIQPAYQLYLSHKAPVLGETVLFATAAP